MSQWGGNTSTQPPAPGQVTFFDPTKFQKNPGNIPAVPTSPLNNVDGQGQVEGQAGNNSQHSGEQNSWNTWGAWDGKANPYAGDFNGGVTQATGTGDQIVNKDCSNYNQQQWYGQNQFGNITQQTDQVQGQWNQNNQQWSQQQYNYQQESDPIKNSGYNNYWAGQNGDYQPQGNYPNSGLAGSENITSASYFVQDPNDQYVLSGANYIESNQEANVTGTCHVGESVGDLHVDVSQSTESGSQSLNQSIGNIEDRGTMGVFYNNDEDDGESEDDCESEDDGESDDDDDEVSNDKNNYNIELSDGHIHHEIKTDRDNAQGHGHDLPSVISDSETPQLEITDHIQVLTVQEAAVSQPTDTCSQGVDMPLYSNQRSNALSVHADAQFLSPVQHPFPPQQVGSHKGEKTVDNETDNQIVKQETPSFSDWEMVPSSTAVTTHSRNASADNNVHFFISSTNSSARVSPASSKAGEEKTGNMHEEHTNRKETLPNKQNGAVKVNVQGSVVAAAHQQSVTGAPPTLAVGPPLLSTGASKGVNHFRKSPNIDPAAVPMTSDASMLSSTRLDITRPNCEHSPVVLNQSISPIIANLDTRGHVDNETPELQMLSKSGHGHMPDTPVSTQTRKSAAVPHSPVILRKESPFQPPKQDSRMKPLKASHDIPGVNAQKSSSDTAISGPYDRQERRTPDHGLGRRNLDRDYDRDLGRRTPNGDPDRDLGRRTPDWDSGDQTNDGRRIVEKDMKRRPDRDDRERYKRDRDKYGPDSEKVTSRPPSGSSALERASTTRNRQSAFHHIQTNRNKNNVSPAASLLDVADSVPAMPNILLMPASNAVGTVSQNSSSTVSKIANVTAPSVLTPVVSLISSMSEQIMADNTQDDGKVSNNSIKVSDRDSKNKYGDQDRLRDRDDRSRYKRDRDRERGSRDDLRGNRSYDNLGERGLKDTRNNSREKLNTYGSRDSLDMDDSRDRTRRDDSRERDRSYRDDYYDRYRERNRPPSRTSTVDTRRDYRDRDREYYRRTDKYDRDRPRSRQGDRDRAGSRHGDADIPKSRADYDREIEKYREKNRGYDYDYHRRQAYEKQYYDYYYGNYNQGYYDDQGYYHAESAAPGYPYEQYQRRSRTGTPGSLSDGGEEISSIAEKSKKSDKKRFDYPPELHDYSQRGYDEYYSYYGYEQNGHRWDPDISAWVATTTEVIPQRQTPEKFMIPHMRACLGPNGQLVKVLPNRPADGQPAIIEIHDVHVLLENNEEAEVLNEFPGPLIRGDTHKNDVQLFCQSKAKMCMENMNLEDRESAELIWKFLELLIKQNGTVVGTDIADLILQGHEPTTREYRRSGMKIAASTDNIDGDDESEDNQSQKLSRDSTPIDRSFVDRSLVGKGKSSMEEVTDRFRHLLMYGRKKDALDWAMKNNLWGHALFLASKMDSRAHANVMTRFANVAMRMNDPLQTLYQMMSGRQPAAVTCVAEDRWGDWRPHLAMILSNHTQKPDLDRKSITTLGDTLASRGFLHASHFCYLMSQTNFGSYNRKSSKIVLIGSSHGLPLQYFANALAIQCTEIYEYALTLGNMMMNLTSFQTFKYLYATRLADYGYAQEALQYCEVISRHINMNPAFHQHILVKLVYDLSCQLKFSQPQMEEDEDMPDPDWLRALHTTLVQFEEGAIQPISGTATPAYYGGRTTSSSDSGEVGMYMQSGDNGTIYSQDGSYLPNNGGMSRIHEHYQPHPDTETQAHQYQQQGTQYSNGVDASQTQQYSTENMLSGVDNLTQAVPGADNQQYQQGDNSYQQHGQITEEQNGNVQWPEHQIDSANQHTAFNSTIQNQSNIEQTNHNVANNYQHESAGMMGSDGHYTQQQLQYQKQPGFHPNVNLGESQTSVMSAESAKRSSLASTSSFSQDVTGEEGEDQLDSGGFNPAPSIFDIQPAQQRIIAPKLRKRTVSETSNGSSAGRDRHPSGNRSLQAQKSADNKDSLSQPKQKPGSGGIFAKIGGLFSRKNEMKLPDDKEPSIVWDDVKKRWVDKDADEPEEKPTAPPPKDHELPGSGPGVPSSAPSSGPVAGSTPTRDQLPTSGNKFSMRRGPKYVDVMNPKPASTAQVPSNLFQSLPSSHSAPAIFNPMGTADDSSTDVAPQVHDAIPEEKSNQGADNSSHLQLPPMSDNLSRNSSASSLSREVQRIMSKTSTTAAPASEMNTSMPTMFNPAQFQANQTFKQPAPPGPGHRLTNRRVYPK